MDLLFGKRKTPAEQLREHQRSLTKAQRELDRERSRLQVQEKKLIADLKKAAKDGQSGACKVMAKDLVRTRKYVQKFYQMKTQLQAVSLRLQTLSSNQQMSEAMKGATLAMRAMNRRMNLPQMQKIMMDFSMQSEAMDMKEEMMGEAIDDVMDDQSEDEEEQEQVIQQVLDEIGINLGQQLVNAPSGTPLASTPLSNQPKVAVAEGGAAAVGAVGGGTSTGGTGNEDLDSLQARLDALRK